MIVLLDYGSEYLRSAQRALKKRKVFVTLQCDKGHDVDAACGQLRLKTERELTAAGPQD